MAQNLVLEDAAVNAEANALAALLNSGKLRIYETASLLAELTFNATAFGGASAGGEISQLVPLAGRLGFGRAGRPWILTEKTISSRATNESWPSC